MKLGLGIDLWNQAQLDVPLQKIQLAEELGFDSVWMAEIYGADAITPLAFLAAHTNRIKLGTAVIQVAARPPVTTAMQMGTVEALAGNTGRVICGLGVSGPQIVEGWYGRPWASPHQTLRDYVSIMRQVFRREDKVEHDGKVHSLPYKGPEGLGIGKPLKSILHMAPDLPIYLATGGPMNTKLTAELADGWLPLGYTPGSAHLYKEQLDAGRANRDPLLGPLQIQASATVVITDDVQAALDARKTQTAFLVGGYGTKDHNFHRDAMVRRGFAAEADRIQELFIAGKRDEAAAAVPDDYIDDGALIGTRKRIAERWNRWTDGTEATGITVRVDDPDTMRFLAGLSQS